MAVVVMRQEDIEEIAETAATKAVTKCLFNLGIDMSTPDSILLTRDYMRHVRTQYEACEAVKRHGMKTIITAIGTVLLAIGGYVVMLLRGGN